MPPKRTSPCPHLISTERLRDVYPELGIRKDPHGRGFLVSYQDPARPGSHGTTATARPFNTQQGCEDELKRIAAYVQTFPTSKTRHRKGTWTAQQVFDAWVPVAELSRSEGTMKLYKSVWSNHLSSRFGSHNVMRLTHAATKRYLAELTQKGMSPALRTKVANVLRLMLRWAFDEGITQGHDLSAGIKGVTEDRKKHKGDFLNSAQMKKLLAAVKTVDAWYFPHTLTMAHTGLRIGEMLALRWDDDIVLSGKNPYVEVHYTLSKEGVLKEPKTRAAKRRVGMTKELAACLKQFRKDQKQKKLSHPDGLAMLTATGEAANCDNYRLRIFAKAVTAAGIKTRCVPHTLRHSYLSILAEQPGVAPATIMAIAGHEDYRTTAEIYIGTTQASIDKAAVAFEKGYR